MLYTRKQIRQTTGLPDKTLRWLLDRLEIEPIDIERTLFGSPIYLYDDSALDRLHSYIFRRAEHKAELAKGRRCRGGCNRYLQLSELNTQQICDSCRRRAWLLNEITHNNPAVNAVDSSVVEDIIQTLQKLTANKQ